MPLPTPRFSAPVVTSRSSNGYALETLDAALQQPVRSASGARRWAGAIARVTAKRGVRVALFVLALVALMSFSVAWVYHVGHRGLFMLDQSIVFDGAWRIVQGQVPYRDFVMPFGPVTFALCAVMFHWLGVDFSTLVWTAALSSALASAVSVRLSWLLTARSGALALLGGLMTAVWFQAPFGTPWMEQTAFLFNLLALWGIVEGRLGVSDAAAGGAPAAQPARPPRARRSRCLWSALAGVASVAAVLSKQNAGGLFLFLCIGALWVPGRERGRAAWRPTLAYAAGALVATAAFVGWLALCSDLARFKHYWIDVSSEIGASRVAYWKVLGTIVFQPLLSSSAALFLLASLVGVVSAALLVSGRAHGIDTRLGLCAWLCVALPQFHGAFQLTTNNDASNNNAFVGLTVVCLAALLVHGLARSPTLGAGEAPQLAGAALATRPLVGATSLLIGGLVLYSTAEGLMVAHGRFVQEFAPGTSFDQRLDVPGARGVRWGEPTRITPQFCGSLGDMCKISSASTALDHSYEILERRDVERVASALRRRDQNFFVFPDATLLYGLLGRPSPQPLLYFHPGQSYSLADQAELDRAIVDALERHDIGSVVLERASFMGTHKLLGDFPRLEAWIQSRFELREELGNYRLLDARSAARPSDARSRVQ